MTGRHLSRRAVLIGGASLGVGAVAAGAGVITDVLPGGPPLRRALGMTGPDGTVPEVPAGAVTIDRMRSSARGQVVDLVTMAPHGVPAEGLPVCLGAAPARQARARLRLARAAGVPDGRGALRCAAVRRGRGGRWTRELLVARAGRR